MLVAKCPIKVAFRIGDDALLVVINIGFSYYIESRLTATGTSLKNILSSIFNISMIMQHKYLMQDENKLHAKPF